MVKTKFQRQGTYAPQELEILHAIDERFEELEETIILASLVPQLHERLFAVEQLLNLKKDQISSSSSSGSKLDTSSKLADKLQKVPSASPLNAPRLGAQAPSPARKAAPDEEETVDDEGNIIMVELEPPPLPVSVSSRISVEDLAALSPLQRREVKKMTEISRDKVSVIDEKTLDTQTNEYYTFGESTWDLVIFIGTGALGPLGSFQTFLLAVVNVLMQVVFVAIAAYNFTSPDVDEEAILASLRWRRSSGHSFADYSAVAKESLVHRVCKIDKSLESSGIQVALMEDINKYLKSDAAGMEGFFTGQILCIVALVCWYLMVAKEVSHALALHRGVMAMPRGLTKLDQRENPFTQVVHYRLRAVTFSRKLASGLLLLYRLVAAGLLVMVGTYFLVYTVSVTELILNAVALGIILDIDDLLFDALATTPGRHLVHQLDPLPMPSLPRIRGADAKSVFMSLAIPGLTLFVYFTMLGPMVQTLEEVKSAMCGGNVDFVWTLDKNRITRLSPTVGGGWDEEEDSIKTRAIEEAERIGYGSSINQTRFGLWESEVSVLSDIAAMSHPELVQASNPSCGDLANQEPLLNYLRYFLQNDSIQSCADALPYCNSVTKMPEYGGDEGRGWATRYLCAESCGCRNPGGEGISLQGCPADDCRATPDFTSFRESSVCIEKNASRLRRFAPWVAWVETIRAYGLSPAQLDRQADALLIANAMWENGCGFMQNLTDQNISWGSCFAWSSTFNWEFKTVEAFCPITCGCSETHRAYTGCPLPYGFSCDGLWHCLTWNEQHYCPPYVEVIYGEFTMSYNYSHVGVLSEYYWSLVNAMKVAIAEHAGHSQALHPDTIVPEWLFDIGIVYGAFQIFLVDPAMNATQMQLTMFSTPASHFQATLQSTLDSWSVPWMGLQLESISPPVVDETRDREKRRLKRSVALP